MRGRTCTRAICSSQTVPQNHRMFGVGRDLCGSPSPTPLPPATSQGCPWLQEDTRPTDSLSGNGDPSLQSLEEHRACGCEGSSPGSANIWKPRSAASAPRRCEGRCPSPGSWQCYRWRENPSAPHPSAWVGPSSLEKSHPPRPKGLGTAQPSPARSSAANGAALGSRAASAPALGLTQLGTTAQPGPSLPTAVLDTAHQDRLGNTRQSHQSDTQQHTRGLPPRRQLAKLVTSQQHRAPGYGGSAGKAAKPAASGAGASCPPDRRAAHVPLSLPPSLPPQSAASPPPVLVMVTGTPWTCTPLMLMVCMACAAAAS